MNDKPSTQTFNNLGTEDYLKHRLQDQIQWMEQKSITSKKRFQYGRLVVILLSVVIPFLVSLLEVYPSIKYVIGGVGVLIAAVEGILSLFDYQNNWVNYRQTLEALKREQFLFATRSGIYKKDNTLQTLVERVESLLATENQTWADVAAKNDTIKKEE
ncbi:MAG: DUF4231 domain-containing protein [Bacteroidota bacterium]